MQDRSRLQSQLGTFDSSAPHVVAAAGDHVILADGRRLLDLNSGYWCLPLGYGRISLAKAASRTLRGLSYAHLYRRTHEPAAELANTLAAITPAGVCAKVLFSNDGTGAAETALRLAMRWSNQRPKADTIVVLRSGYHGDSLVVRELGDYSTRERRIALPHLRIRKIEPPLAGRSISAALKTVQRLADQSRLAAFFCEVVQGLGGIRPIDGEFLRCTQSLCERAGALFIVDEIATGFARTGRMFAFEHHDLRPDLVLIGKGLTNGTFPMAAVLVSARVSPILVTEFQHGHTTSGHPVGCTLAQQVIREIIERRLADRAQRLGGEVLSLLRAAELSKVEVRGLGLFIGIDLATTKRASHVRHVLEQRGIMAGQEAGVLTVVPPLTMRRSDLMTAITEIIGAITSPMQNRGGTIESAGSSRNLSSVA